MITDFIKLTDEFGDPFLIKKDIIGKVYMDSDKKTRLIANNGVEIEIGESVDEIYELLQNNI